MLQWHTTLRDTRGFSLVELMIVVTIMGILAMILIPRGSRQSEIGASLEGDARVFAQNARLAREQAMTRGAQIGIEFTQSNAYQILNPVSKEIIKDDIELNRGITVSAGTKVAFDASGKAPADVVITFQADDGRRRDVTVNKLGIVNVGQVYP